METLVLKTSFFAKKAFLFLLVTGMAISTVNARTTEPTPGDETTSVAFLRLVNDQVFFVVKYANAAGGKFEVLVNDGTGENLYRGTFSGKDFTKVFRAPADSEKLVVIIRTGKMKDDQKFEIKSEARVIQETYVKRM